MNKTIVAIVLVFMCSIAFVPKDVQAAPLVQSSYGGELVSAGVGRMLSNYQPALLLVNPFKWVEDTIGGAASNVGNFFSGVAKTAGNVVTAPFKLAGKVVSAPFKAIKNVGSGILGAGKKLVTGIGNVVTAPFKFAGNVFSSATKGVGGFFKGVGSFFKWGLIILIILLLLPVIMFLINTCRILARGKKLVKDRADKKAAAQQEAQQPAVIVVQSPPGAPVSHGPAAVSFDK